MKYLSLKRLFDALAPYRDVIVFMVTLLVANYFWKFTVTGDENDEVVTWFGMDITAPFAYLCAHITRVVYWLVALVRDTAYLDGGNTIRFESGNGSSIVWGCSGLKQAFIWFWLIFTVRGGWIHKLWFIPAGWIACHLFNILRIFLITLFIEYHPEWFDFLHGYIFKYLFYAMLFGLWVLFVEKIRPSSSAR